MAEYYGDSGDASQFAFPESDPQAYYDPTQDPNSPMYDPYGGGATPDTHGQYDPTQDPNSPMYDPYGGGATPDTHGQYDPTQDPASPDYIGNVQGTGIDTGNPFANWLKKQSVGSGPGGGGKPGGGGGGSTPEGAIAKGAKSQQEIRAEQQWRHDQARLQAARMQRDMPGARMSDAARGDVLANVQDYQLSGSGRDLSSTGGLRPSLFSQGTRDLGRSASRQAMLSQLASTGEGPKPGGVDPYANTQPMPIPDISKLGQVAGGVSTVRSLLDAYGGNIPFFKKKPEPDYSNPDLAGTY